MTKYGWGNDAQSQFINMVYHVTITQGFVIEMDLLS